MSLVSRSRPGRAEITPEEESMLNLLTPSPPRIEINKSYILQFSYRGAKKKRFKFINDFKIIINNLHISRAILIFYPKKQ